MYRTPFLVFLLSVTVGFLFIGATNVSAASIKDRMVARLPVINSLKDKGIIGENNKGFLVYRSGSQPEKSTIDAENSDRQQIYNAIAKKTGVDPGLVGSRRAQKIAEIGGSGHWFQKPDGTWYKK